METRPDSRAPRVTLVLAICAARGATGFSLGLAGVLSWNEPIPEMQALELPLPPEGEEEAWKRVEEAYQALPDVQGQVLRSQRPALNALSGVNLVASGMLLYGALVARMRRPGGLSSLRTGLVLSQAYAFLATLVQTWVQLSVLEQQRPVLMPLLQEEGTVRSVALLAIVAQMGAVAITAAITLLQLLFYWWVHRWTRRPAVQEALSPPA